MKSNEVSLDCHSFGAMALTVGITGGIGSGKTTACRIFESLGVRVFYADDQAKALYYTDVTLKKEVCEAFGEGIYPDGKFSKENLASIVFEDAAKLKILNDLVHPALARAFKEWCDRFESDVYILKEAAILIESGGHKNCDSLVVVSCPEEIRIQRVMERDQVSAEDVQGRMNHQLSEADRLAHATFELVNDGTKPVTPQVSDLHEKLIALARTH